MVVLPFAACAAIATFLAGVLAPPRGPRLLLGALVLGTGVVLADLAVGALCIHQTLAAGYLVCGALAAAGLALRWLRTRYADPPDESGGGDDDGPPRRPPPTPPRWDWEAFDRARRRWERSRPREPVR
ncbi:MAG TPA: hypothetical protein VMT10_11750 [Solirubrobacteraceae bacterium]|nr:hypothetical protein [Solirubrobacteraceae bacterium]